jgi:hypothetical protein
MMSSSSERQFISLSNGGMDHVTKQLLRFRVMDVVKNIATRYRLLDSWGCTSKNYKNVFLSLISGKLPAGWNMNSKNDGLPHQQNNNNNNKNNNLGVQENQTTPHCIIFFITAADLLSNSENVVLLDGFAEMALYERNIRSICVVTKSEEYLSTPPPPLQPQLRLVQASLAFSRVVNPQLQVANQPLLCATKNARVGELKQLASQKFKIPSCDVYLLQNYVDEASKSLEIDKHIFSIFNAATEKAHETFSCSM